MSLNVLNVGAGDIKLSFDKSDPAERIRAARIVRDMLKRGYALLIETGRDNQNRPVYTRALDFDENTCEYIIADYDPAVPSELPAASTQSTQAETNEPPVKSKRGRKPTKRVAADSTSGVAVARVAGG
jgi:hypothetical protein